MRIAVGGKDSRHGSLASGDGLLHCASAGLHGAHSVAELQCARGYMGRPFTKRVSRSQRRLDALFGEDTAGRDAYGQDGRLHILGQLQLVFRSLEAELRRAGSRKLRRLRRTFELR